MANRRQLPPLQTLVFFEAAVRHLSFTAAAQELGTSQPAVSNRISLLEQDLGVPLFKREHRGVSLTADGANLYEAVRASLGAISETVAKIRARGARQLLTVATDFGLATYWLMPRLASLRQLLPDLDVRIVTSQNEIDIRAEPVDVAIAFGNGQWPGCAAEALFPEQVIPVCSPAFHAAHGVTGLPAELRRLPLLHLEAGAGARWLTWDDWFAQQGLPRSEERQHLTLNNYPLLMQAAIAGQGVALGWLPLVDELLKTGQLLTLATQPLQTERGYFLVEPNAQRSPHAQAQFRQWIRAECRRM